MSKVKLINLLIQAYGKVVTLTDIDYSDTAVLFRLRTGKLSIEYRVSANLFVERVEGRLLVSDQDSWEQEQVLKSVSLTLPQ